VKANVRWTTAVAVTLTVVGATAFVAPPAADPAPGGPTTEAAPLAVGAVDVPLQPDSGGHRVGAESSGPTEYALYGNRWSDKDLTYGFAHRTNDLSFAAQEAAVARAVATWSSVSRLTFTEVADCGLAFDSPNCQSPDIRIAFGTGDHAGGVHDPDFDGPGGTAAHSFYPPPNGSSAAGDLHLDDAEHWTTSGGGVDLESVVLHELGHSLGLSHAAGPQCPLQASPNRPIMCGTIVGIDRTVAPDDIAGIQALYGLPLVSCAGRAVTVDLGQGQVPTAGADVVLGTPGPDTITTGNGADIVCGGGGDDTIDPGAGNDRSLGGAGNDVLYGRTGADRLEGGGGNDRLSAGDGNDQIYGGSGGDTLAGGTGSDQLYAGSQSDTCNGRGGNDAQTGCERRTSIESRIG